jgi:hypothetical protein
MRKATLYAILTVLTVATAVLPGYCHRPLDIFGNHPNPEQALLVGDIDVSQVAYEELTEAEPSLWMKVELSVPATLDLSLGVPVIDRLTSYRPSLAVIGPGLSEVSLPSSLRASMSAADGGVVLATQYVSVPEEFHEPFTGTDSWILGKWSVDLPMAGRYYVVAYDPSGEIGKLWVAIGEKEAFSASDIFALPATIRAVRRFHEVGGDPVWLNTIGYSAMALVAIGLWLWTAR